MKTELETKIAKANANSMLSKDAKKKYIDYLHNEAKAEEKHYNNLFDDMFAENKLNKEISDLTELMGIIGAGAHGYKELEVERKKLKEKISRMKKSKSDK